jgi:hypothetical protein
MIPYFKGYRFEDGGRLYRKLGVHHFKKIVPFGDYFFKVIRLFYPKASIVGNRMLMKKDIHASIFFMMFVETIHLVFFFIMNRFLIKTYLDTSTLSIKIYLIEYFYKCTTHTGTTL